MKKRSGLYKHAVKMTSRNRLRKSVVNSLRAHYFPQKQENIRLARARRKQKRPTSLKFRGQLVKPPKPPIVLEKREDLRIARARLKRKGLVISLKDFKKELGL